MHLVILRLLKKSKIKMKLTSTENKEHCLIKSNFDFFFLEIVYSTLDQKASIQSFVNINFEHQLHNHKFNLS